MKEDLLIKLIEMLVSGGSDQTKDSDLIGKGVIVRCRDAGVHYGELIGYSGRTVELKNSRRMWRWWAASEHTLSGVVRHGIKQSESKIAGPIDKIILQDACEIIPISGTPEESIKTAEIYNEQ